MNLDNILTHPALAGMRAVDQWVAYVLVPSTKRPGKMDKVPLNARTGNPTAVNDPASWSDCATAVAMARSMGAHGGAGFCFTEAAGYWFVDLDSCYENGAWSDLAQQAGAIFAGCAFEVSQSGTGLHVFGRGPVPPHASKNIALHAELYTTDRFVALTGESLQGNCEHQATAAIQWFAQTYFPPRAAAGVALPDEGPRADWHGPADNNELLRRAMQSRSAASAFGGKACFADLWHADADVLGRAYPHDSEPFDRSSADLALAQHLAFWTGCDQARIERLMHESKLWREKWEAREDYLPRTIATACAQQRDVLQDKPPLTLEDARRQLLDARPDAARATWLDLAMRLAPLDAEAFVELGTQCAGAGRQALKAALRDARQAANRERQTAALTARVAGRAIIEWRPEDSTAHGDAVERLIVASAAPGEYMSFAGRLSRVATKPLPFTHLVDDADEAPPPVPQLEPLSKVDVLGHVERVAAFYEVRARGDQKLIGVPDRLLEVVREKNTHAAPTISGLVTHPIVLRDGTILASNGLHSGTGLFLSGLPDAAAHAYSQREAGQALRRLREDVLGEFEFASHLDADIALAGLFTGVQRRLLDSAPGLAVLANTPSSGKTTLLRRVHILLTGHDMPASTFALGNESEVAKALLAMLLRNPAMVCFDNIREGFTFTSGTLAAAMTSASIEQRLLGANTDASPSTNVLFTLTGNNLSLGNDEVTRWLVSRLAPRTARPQERTFKHPDVVAYALGVRARVLADVVGVVAGFIAACGAGQAPRSRFPTWDRMVRQPLMWAGAADVAEVFRSNAAESEPMRAHRAALWALHRVFGDQWFKASEVVARADAALREALEILKARVDSPNSVGLALKKHVGKVAEVDGRELKITAGEDRHSKLGVYRVAVAGSAGF